MPLRWRYSDNSNSHCAQQPNSCYECRRGRGLYQFAPSASFCRCNREHRRLPPGSARCSLRFWKEPSMRIPFFKEMKIGAYLLKQKMLGRKRYPLVLMLEPLFRCNLACSGCGKIDYPDPILNRRLSVEECLDAADECGAPMVAIPGGEPLIHREIGEIVKGLVARKKFVSLCTNALLLEKKLHLFEPSPYLFFSVHLDG